MSESQKISLPERFDFSFHRQFLALYENAFSSEACKHIVLDFSRVNYLDSSALGMMVLLHKKAKLANISTSINGANGTASDILKMTNFHNLYDIT
jgi:anti-anti-sigma factor